MSRSALLALLICLPAFASASGQLDPRFDGDGVRIVDADRNSGNYDRFSVGMVDAQGRLIGAGNTIGAIRDGFAVRLLPNGNLDPSFGSGGIARLLQVTDFNAVRWKAVLERPDGRLLFGGSLFGNGITRGVLCQVLANGSPDPAFGEAGCRQLQFWPESNRDEIVDFALQNDGKVVALGRTDVALGAVEWVVARFDEEGVFDPCFGDASCQFGGYLIEPEPQADSGLFEPRALALAPDGRIVLAGSLPLNANADMGVIRLLPTGEADVGFGNGGHRKITFNLGGNDFDRADDVVVAPNGRVLVVGQVRTDTSTLAAAAALDASGNPVLSYGDNGRRVFFFNDVSPIQVATAAALQSDGKLAVAGYVALTGESAIDCGAARLDAEGDLDPTFGFGGTRSYDGSPQQDGTLLDGCYSIGLHGGAIFLFGDTGTDHNNIRDSLVMKLDQDTILRDGFED